MRQYDFKKAMELSGRIVKENPTIIMRTSIAENIYLEMGDLAHAEAEYTRAYELSPPQVLLEKLRTVRERRERRTNQVAPTPAP